MTAEDIIALAGEIAKLAPLAVDLVKELVSGLKGKSDQEILAEDLAGWAAIIAAAKAEVDPAQPKPIGPEPGKE